MTGATPRPVPARRAARIAEALLVVAAAVWAYRAFLGRVQMLWSSILDDSYISLRYARNLALGSGLVYNPGERVEGYTNFLWTVGLAPAFRLGADPFFWCKTAAAVFAVLAALATFWLGLRVLPAAAGDSGESHHGDLTLAALAAALWLGNPLVGLSAGEGLETTLFTFLLVATVAAFVGERSVPGSAGLAVLLGMARPDGAVFGPLLWLAAVAMRRRRAYLVVFAAVFAVGFGGYWVARWMYYQAPLPNTFYAKAVPGGQAELWGLGWSRLGEFVALTGGWAWLLALPALIWRRTRRAGAVIALVVGLRIAFHLWSGGPYMGLHRFLVPVLPFLYLLALATVAVPRRWRWVRLAAATGVAALFLRPAIVAYPTLEYRARYYGRGLERGHVELGRALAAMTAPAASLALIDAGAAPYFSERETIDMLGLNDAHIARLPGMFGDKVDVGYVLGRRPDVVVLVSRSETPSRAEDFAVAIEKALYADAGFQSRYRPAGQFQFHRGYWLHLFVGTGSRLVHPRLATGE